VTTPSHLNHLEIGPGHCAVVGLQWGDEGKGKIVDLFAPKYDLIVRYNGGANAGHSVQVDDQRFALHLIPSGILYPDKINVLGNGVVIDPEMVVKEIQGLRDRGVTITDNFRISNRAHVVFPYHKLQDQLFEAVLSQTQGDDQKIGTTGRGIGPCYADKALRSTAIRVGELLDTQHLSDKLRYIVAIKNLELQALATHCSMPYEPFDSQVLCLQYMQYAAQLHPHICDTTALLHDAMQAESRILFEGANATLLDIDHGTYPFVTSSNCSALGIPAGTSVPGQKIRQVMGIIKAYTTRVGGGPMPTELNDPTGDHIRKVGKEFGTTTGRPRRCGWLDLMAVKYTAKISGATGLCLMLLDVLAGMDPLKVCIGYQHAGKTLDAFPTDAQGLEQVDPIYESLPGFLQPITDCRQFSQLPPQAQAYVRMIEQHVGVPIRIISVGPRRDQTIVR